ncbi:ABC transporter substrate-binding protein [Aquitalea sp. LB_tupeE]|uniref:substrate-binding periplasmic protein n=1 Tax=Aquitalea sp. LB_tupeE TaxID=2748078 RepID=UPI0015B7CB8A|nr:ABC transporter substrate-binding protein [Aquitalea sp. LB_tupeE]NWK76665.1 ABC transporter substrate-binding protein [Aquitalea sp. LB_tupeE]
MKRMLPALSIPLAMLFLASPCAQAGTLTIACEDNLPPFSSEAAGQPHGIVVDIVQLLIRQLGLNETVHLYPWNRVLSMGLNQPNTLVCAMARTPERENRFQWVGEIIHSPPVLLMLADNGGHIPHNGKLTDYQNYAIGVLHGSYQEKYLQEHGFTHLEAFSSYREGYEMLRARRIRLWAANQLTAYSTVQQMHEQPGQVLQTAFVFKQLPQGMSMAFSQGTAPATVEAFRQALEGIKHDGRYQQILKQNSE